MVCLCHGELHQDEKAHGMGLLPSVSRERRKIHTLLRGGGWGGGWDLDKCDLHSLFMPLILSHVNPFTQKTKVLLYSTCILFLFCVLCVLTKLPSACSHDICINYYLWHHCSRANVY
jgi:hypothetical protein